MALDWNERLMSTGVVEVDNQHKELISKLNLLFEALESGAPEAEVKSMLKFLGEYTTWHFSAEEDCFAKYECPAAEANKAAHATFLDIFQGISEKVESEGVTSALAIETQQEVSNWVRNHIVRIDTKLRPCAAAAS
jgi:hemerythrin